MIFKDLFKVSSSPPGRSTRPIFPLKSVSPVNKQSSISKHTPPLVCPGVNITLIEKLFI